MVMPFTLGTPPPPGFVSAVMIVSSLGPGGKAADIAGTLITIVSGVLVVPGVQLAIPRLALVKVVTAPVRTSVSVTRPPVAPAAPAMPMKSPWMLTCRELAPGLGAYG